MFSRLFKKKPGVIEPNEPLLDHPIIDSSVVTKHGVGTVSDMFVLKEIKPGLTVAEDKQNYQFMKLAHRLLTSEAEYTENHEVTASIESSKIMKDLTNSRELVRVMKLDDTSDLTENEVFKQLAEDYKVIDENTGNPIVEEGGYIDVKSNFFKDIPYDIANDLLTLIIEESIQEDSEFMKLFHKIFQGVDAIYLLKYEEPISTQRPKFYYKNEKKELYEHVIFNTDLQKNIQANSSVKYLKQNGMYLHIEVLPVAQPQAAASMTQAQATASMKQAQAASGGAKAASRSKRSKAARTVRKSLRRKRKRRSSKASGNR
jgi:hypothetical protein